MQNNSERVRVTRSLQLTVFFVVAGIFAFLPLILLAWSVPLVPCGNETSDMCVPCDLVALAQRIMNFFVFLVVIVAALLFVNAGMLYLFSPANPANIAKAHRLFINTLIGLIIILASFLVIDFAMKTLYGESGEWGPWNSILCTDTDIAAPPRPSSPGSGDDGAGVVGEPAPGGIDTSSFLSLRAMGLTVADWYGIDGPGRTDLLRPDAAGAISSAYYAGLSQYGETPFQITSAYTEGVGHSANSKHYEGHAVDFQPIPGSEITLAQLAQLARDAGFTYVLIEARHVHADMR